MNIKHLIWTNDIPSEVYKNELRQAVAERDEKPVSEVTDDEMWDEFHHDTDDLWHCEKANLDRPLDGRVLMIASLGLWTGRKTGYRLTEATNLNAVLEGFCGDFVTVGSDGHNIVASDEHHDGTNYYTFREVREDRNIEVLLEKLYSGTATNSDINRYTRSLERKARSVYGWQTRAIYGKQATTGEGAIPRRFCFPEMAAGYSDGVSGRLHTVSLSQFTLTTPID